MDLKKAQLLDSYLLKPLSINAQGVYQPLAGRFTMLGSMQYQARNHQTSINQPIYVDFKTGNIYLWADNFALLNSQFLDDKLGTKWQNKWLKLTVDDGSLPKGFGRSVIENHFKALDQTYNAAPVSQFAFISPQDLTALSPKLPEHQLAPMLQSPQVIKRVQSADSYAQSYKDYLTTFYNLIRDEYPDLLEEEKPYEAGAPRPDAAKVTSKLLVQQVLMLMGSVDNDAALDATSAQDDDSAMQHLYGLNKRGQIEWQHISNHNLSNHTLNSYTLSNYKENANVDGDVSKTINILNQYAPISAQSSPFPNLPAAMQTPNASNSIDIKEYAGELAEYYREGNGTAVGKMMFNMLPLYKALYFAKANDTGYEDEEANVADADEVVIVYE